MKKQVASLVEAALNKSVKFDDQVNDEEKYIMSMVQAAVTYVINEESMLDWEGNMKHEKDHEKRVVLEDIPSDDTMISSLALCEKEQMAVSSYFVDQDEDINAT